MRRPPGKPCRRISSNLERPPDNRFINNPKNRKLGIKPYQKRFSLVASRIPLPAKTKPSNHFLQFIETIIAYVVLIIVFFSQLEISLHNMIVVIKGYACQVISVRFLGFCPCCERVFGEKTMT